jgi:hypothetical protein
MAAQEGAGHVGAIDFETLARAAVLIGEPVSWNIAAPVESSGSKLNPQRFSARTLKQ